MMKRLSFALSFALLPFPVLAAPANVDFTVAMSEAVTVSGCPATCPRIAIDVGGQTRYAQYSAGSGSSSLTFSYAPTIGDLDLDGVTLSSPVDLNGGTMTDLNGNPITNLTFTVPNTTGIKINYPSLSMDFTNGASGRYTLNGTAYTDFSSFLGAASGTFTRVSAATYYDSTGTLQTASVNTPRFDHDPITLTPKGILIEEQRTNLITYSHSFENAVWGNFLGTRVSGLTAPDGSSNGVTLTGPSSTSAAARHGLIATSTSMTYSIFVKYISGGALKSFLLRNNTTATNFDSLTFNLQTGNIISGAGWSTQDVGNGWYRLSYTRTTGISINDDLGVYFGTTGGLNTADQWGLWGAQLEQGSFPTSYIPTTTAAVTRQADNLTIPTGGWYNASNGTTYTIFVAPDASVNRAPFTLSDNTINNRMHVYASSTASFVVLDANVYQAISGSTILITQGQSIKASFAYKDNDFAGTFTGGATTNDTTGAVPSVTQLTIGRLTNAGYMNNAIPLFKYYPIRATDPQLQLLTQ